MIPVLDKRLTPRPPGYHEQMLLTNVNTVGDLRDALKFLNDDTPVEVRTPYVGVPGVQTERLRVEEVVLLDDGHVVVYVSP